MKMKGKSISIIVFLLGLFCSVAAFDTVAKAAGGSQISVASNYSLGSNESGYITENGSEKLYYKFTLPTSGVINITSSAYMERINFYIYNEKAEEVYHWAPYWNSTSEVIAFNDSINLTSGVYYFCVGKYWSYVGNYSFKIDFTSAGETFLETQGGSDNTLATAHNIDIGSNNVYNGQIAYNDDKDFYKFALSDSGMITINATFYKMKHVSWKLYDEDGVELYYNNPYWNSTSENIVVQENVYLTSGSYYLCVSKYDYNGNYSFSIPFTSSGESFKEGNGGNNNTLATASQISVGKTYKGLIAINDTKDFYTFDVTSNAVVINVDAYYHYGDVVLYDSNGKELWTEWLSRSWNSVKNTANLSKRTVLETGKYYLAISKSDDPGNYTLNISLLTQDNCPHEYESVWHSATYFGQGYYTYTCKWCGKTYNGDYSGKLLLGTPSISRYSSYGLTKRLRVQWTTVYNASGYQLAYCTKKNFKGAKKITIKGGSKNYRIIKKLKKKKNYYVRVRAYVKSGSKKAYSSWSSKLKLKTR